MNIEFRRACTRVPSNTNKTETTTRPTPYSMNIITTTFRGICVAVAEYLFVSVFN